MAGKVSHQVQSAGTETGMRSGLPCRGARVISRPRDCQRRAGPSTPLPHGAGRQGPAANRQPGDRPCMNINRRRV